MAHAGGWWCEPQNLGHFVIPQLFKVTHQDHFAIICLKLFECQQKSLLELAANVLSRRCQFIIFELIHQLIAGILLADG